jgi:hypothetical protein
MSLGLRILLIVGAVGTMVYFIFQIRRSRMQIGYAVSWTLFSVLLVVMSLFPELFTGLSGLLGFQSPANMIYLAIIFVLLLKQFSMTMKFSRIDEQITGLTQTIALLTSKKQDKGTDPRELIDKR